ncbi:MAG: bifunctional 5,10-methylenetetrahydrofolate dehydrogenase/5,10-methenyltetrahydrofolate cyclohydrolase [Clostridium sp.]|uniref:bifunctional 5,10-methylenetetrahydrofolate dehydrogenase/5,10-methenyltetrahydrofolate cyclohydrolase n=1 Tax=Clostridium sp. TaxID=1506 RepID=UPI002913C3BC|nr:bifunctional 5,10-methylenetetrahydrofolate dehydrogenase/5,10-methenyltetrahydrofolate cyclohydrolase [Clostridium sp.]MDU7338279.1 bifunctional 5,10-methylenetetrahydrofolate dehydrogenase/5,10-methenyltetrahydrofolate cyclohydrolase [Clostridium sp.]
MARIIAGKEIVTSMNGTLKQETTLLKEKGCTPTLAIVRVGDQPESAAYQTGATKRCEKLGIAVQALILPQNSSLNEVLEVIEALNHASGVHGVLLLRPFPAHLDDRAIRDALCCEKDVDGVTNLSLYGVFTGVSQGFPPCTAQACIDILDYCGIPLRGKRVVVVGASLVIGRPVAMMLLARGATVTLCHIDTVDLPSECRRAEIIIAAAGARSLIDESCLSPGQVILDVGVTVGADGRLYGDVDFEAANTVAAALSPVPGGVGTVTTTILAKHVIEAAKRTMPLI